MYSQDHSSSSFTLGLLAGAALGAGLAMLYAPRTGSEVRGQLRQMGQDAMNHLGEMGKTMRQTGERLAEKTKEVAHDAMAEGERAFDRTAADLHNRRPSI